ncbi:MAG: nicotinate phosphoribosyltransferase [Cardiobacteriaceae bacterium]|nr:nicotinate phosphoribosyltransferase [Cardiobacteriaceae bacterium]
MSSPPLLMDFYALTMANAYFREGRHEEIACFDYFFRRVPDGGGYAVFAGLAQLADYLENLRFSEEDVDFLRQKGGFDEGFLRYLQEFRFSGDVLAMQEGEAVFPGEPLLTVRAPLGQCQLLETFLLLTLNHQSLIATKAARMVDVAAGRRVYEFGSRRAHGADAALLGARAAYIGGVHGTANTAAEQHFAIPAIGTMAHAFVQSFPSEYEAFLAYAECYPAHTVLLADTFDTLKSGVPNAIRVHHEYLVPRGQRLKGIRLDSGDLAYLSRRAREMLDAADMHDVQIIVSNSLDEYLIRDLVHQDAAIDAFGVGERLITARSEPVFGGVYKIVALEQGGKSIPKIKLSENMAKTTTPGRKQVWRLYDEGGMAIADVITLHDETIDETAPYLLFDPEHTWKRKQVANFRAEALLTPLFTAGKRVRPTPPLDAIRAHREQALSRLWPEVRRLDNPHGYYVDLSPALWQLKQDMMAQHAGGKS